MIVRSVGPPAEAVREATVGVQSIDTDEAKRDEHLLSADFLDVAKFPEMTFVSKSVKNIKKGSFEVIGDLTIHGVTKEVALTVDTPSPEVKDLWGNVKVGAHATAKINRKDFGLTWNSVLETGGVLVSDTIKLEMDVEAVKK